MDSIWPWKSLTVLNSRCILRISSWWHSIASTSSCSVDNQSCKGLIPMMNLGLFSVLEPLQEFWNSELFIRTNDSTLHLALHCERVKWYHLNVKYKFVLTCGKSYINLSLRNASSWFSRLWYLQFSTGCQITLALWVIFFFGNRKNDAFGFFLVSHL